MYRNVRYAADLIDYLDAQILSYTVTIYSSGWIDINYN